MNNEIDFCGEAKKGMGALPLQTVAIDPGLQVIESEGGSIRLDIFKSDKIERVVFCTIRIKKTSVLESTVLIWPDDNHNFPALWCNLTSIPMVMNVPIFDFIPMTDIISWPEYAVSYVEPVQGLRKKALEMLGEDVINPSYDLPSRSVYALSPYGSVIMVKDTGVSKIPGVVNEYIKPYLELVSKAAPVKDGAERDFYLRKKSEMRKLMKANDPGFQFMVNAFGQEKTRGVFDLIF